MVLFVAESVGRPDGSSKSARDVLLALLAASPPVTVVSSTRCTTPPTLAGREVPSPRWLTAPVWPPFPSRLRPRIIYDVFPWVRAFLGRRRLWSRLSRAGRPRCVVVNGLISHWLWSVLRPRVAQDAYIIVRESPALFDTGVFETFDWAVAALRQYRGFIFVSSRCGAKWLAHPTLADKESYFVPNCCEEELTETLLDEPKARVRRRLGLPPDRFIAVCVGRIDYHKGQDVIVRLANRLTARMPDLLVYFAGSPRRLYAAGLRQAIEASGTSDRIRMLPARPNALEYIYAADALVLPSRTEALPRVVLEAMALKTPIVAAGVDGVPELIEHGMHGWLFDHDRPEGLVEGLADVASDRGGATLRAERAYERYWKYFDRSNLIRRYGEVVRHLSRPCDGVRK